MKRNLIGGGVLLVLVIFVGLSAYNYFSGSELGGPCRWNDDCKGNLYGKFGSQCFDADEGKGGFCTSRCDAAEDCPKGWSCEEVEYFENDVKKGTSRVCAKPTAAQATDPR